MTSENPAPIPAQAITRNAAALTHTLAEAIRTVPGVIDLAPTLVGEAARLGGALLHHPLPVGGQGVEVQLAEAGAIVQADVALSAQLPLLNTAATIQRTVERVLAHHAVPCASVTVSVLTLHL